MFTLNRIVATTLIGVALLLGTAALTATFAHDYEAGAIRIEHPWTRATARPGMNAAGFMTLTNTGAEADRLVAAEAGFADRAELHRSSMQDGVMRMERQDDGIELPAGETVELAPGGLHVMFIGVAEPLRPDTEVPVTLVFEQAGRVQVMLQVDRPGVKTPSMEHDD
jgi:hypothetical protein